MVIRNQFAAQDPEGNSNNNYAAPPGYNNQGYSNQGYVQQQNTLAEDPWYKSSPQASPVGANTNQNFYNYNTAPSDYSNPQSFGTNEEDYENEPPLLEELGINFDHIWTKTQAVLYLNKQISEHILDDTDLAGPLCFCLLLGALLLLSGKVHFGYIYGFSVFGCIGFQFIISLIHPIGLDFWRTCSVLGYCLLPVIFLAAFAILLDMRGIFGLVLSLFSIAWATMSATRLVDASLNLTEQYWLVAYPIMLLYSCFVLITIF